MTVRASKYFPIATKPKVTQADVDRGSIVRYFVKGISKTNVVEINAEQYNIFKRNPYYTVVKLPWILKGNLFPSVMNGIPVLSIEEQNKKILDFYAKRMPELSRKLTNFLEYASPILNIIPPIPQERSGYVTDNNMNTDTTTSTESSPTSSASPTYTALDVAAAELSYYVLRSDNTLWSWGWNGEGELGLGDNTDRALPTQVAGSWESISVGAYSLLAIKTDNTLWATGLNWDGQLGVGDTTDRNTMTQVTGTGWDKVSTATGYGNHTLAVKTNGTLWAWGSNGYGELGIGSSGSDQLTPVQVGSDTNWTVINAGYDRSFAIKTNGTLWSWGSNGSAALGQGDPDTLAVYTSPTQVGTDTNWTKVSSAWPFTFALKSNGTLWVTGQNISYGLGVGSTDTFLIYDSFTQMGSDTDWADISCGYEQCVARKTNGTVYTWGYNLDGELGLGDTTNRSSPTQVGAGTDWTDVSGGFYDALAVKNNVLTYWGWNYNDYLGTGNEPELSPVSLPYSSNILY